jgi:anti-sigma factor ChrR (cupin superfamily)
VTALARIFARKRRRAALGVVAVVLAGAVVYVQIAAANVTVTSGSATENADQANAGTWVTLSPNIAVAEGARGDFGNGATGAWPTTNLVLTPPSGWQFNAAQTITPTFSGADITGATATVAAGGTSITVTLTGSGRSNGSNDTFALPSVQVRPTATTPLSTGTIGCSSVNNIVGITCGTTTFGTLTETAGALSKLTITSVPASATAGSNFSVTVKSTDAYGNPVNVGSNTVIQLNPSGTGTISNNSGTITAGTNTLTLATVQYTKAESLTLVAHRNSGAVLADSASSSAITVNPGAFTKLQLLVPGETADPGSGTGKTGSPSAQTAGSSFNVTANAVDANWNVVTSATDTVGITSSDANAGLPANAALVAGTKTFSVTLKTAGSRTVTATDITDGSKTANTSPSITVNAGAFSKLQLLVPGETASPGSATGKTGTPSAQTAGTSFNVTVNAVDANWNLVSSTDTVGITSSDANASLPANAALVAGTKNFSVTLKTAGSRTVTATDITDGSKTANTSPSITVNAGAFTKLQLLVPGETADPGSATGKTGTPSAQTAGSSFNVTVNAVDANWNLVSSTDTVGITSSDANASLPANAALVAGTKTFSLTLKTAGSRTVTSTDITDGSKTANTSPAISVNAGAFTKLQLLVPGETASPGSATGKTGMPSAQTAGTSFNVTVNAVDANWNLVSSTDTVGITSSDTNASLPANAALVAGTKTFSVTLKTAGSRTVTATDITDGSKTANTSPSITVNAGAFTKLQLLVPGETADPGSATGKTGSPSAQTAGSSFNVTVNAVDANWNLVSSTDTVGITSSDANASLPANAALVAGTKTFSLTLKTSGSRTVTATDITDGSKTANTSPSITVNAGNFTKLQLLVPGETASPGSASGKTGSPSAQTAGSSFSVTVNAVDANWNLVSSTDTVAISSSDANFAPPANAALVAGTKNFTVSLPTAGSSTLTATDATDGSKTANT